MSKKQTPIARVEKGAEQAFIEGGNLVGNVFGRPEESKEKPKAVPLSENHIETLTHLQLPERIAKILNNPLEKLQLKLESNKAMHNQLNKMIDYHELQTPKSKIVFTYFSQELLDEVEDVWIFKTFSNLGFIFNKKYSTLFIITNATTVTNDYLEMITDWQNNLNYEKVELLLNDKISLLEESDPEVRLERIKDMFDLSEEATDNNDPPESPPFDRANFRLQVTDRFNLAEIETLCFDLDVKYESLGGETIDTKIIALIQHFEKQGDLQRLMDYCKKAKPGEHWEVVSDSPK